MRYTTANAARIMEEALPPEYWADALLYDMPDEDLRPVIERVRGMNDADKKRVANRLAETLKLRDSFMNDPINGIAGINIRGLRLPGGCSGT